VIRPMAPNNVDGSREIIDSFDEQVHLHLDSQAWGAQSRSSSSSAPPLCMELGERQMIQELGSLIPPSITTESGPVNVANPPRRQESSRN